MSKGVVVKGAAYIYIETLVAMVSGYLFWFLMSKIASPDVIGISSAVISVTTIFSTVASIGIPSGIQRFLGKSFSEKKLADAQVFIKTSLILTCVGILGCSITIYVANNWIYNSSKITSGLIVISIVLIASTAVMNLFRSIIISTLRTKMLPLIMILSTIAKLSLAVVLVLIGGGALGLTVGFAFFPIMASILFTFLVLSLFRSATGQVSELRFNKSLKNLWAASIATWVPTVIYTIGSHLGTLLVFGSHGANQAGIYFITFSVVTAIMALMSALFSIAYPTLSAMQDGRKRFTWRSIKLSIALSLPFSSALIFYSKDVMQIFGHEYIAGAASLQILLISILPIAVTTGVNTLVYSYGNYRQVLAIGLASNVPRAALYLIFVPFYHDIVGAAISYTIGSIAGFFISIIIARKIELKLYWKDIVLLLGIPTTLAFLSSYFQLNYAIGILTTLVISYIFFLKIHLLDRGDVEDSLNILPNGISQPILHLLYAISRKSSK